MKRLSVTLLFVILFSITRCGGLCPWEEGVCSASGANGSGGSSSSGSGSSSEGPIEYYQKKLVGGSISNVALDPSTGKLFVAGQFYSFNGIPNPSGLIRMNPDGTQDLTFAMTGTGFFYLGYGIVGNLDVTPLAVTSSGQLYVGGGFGYYNTTQVNRLCRLNADGTLDPSFVTGTGFVGGDDPATIALATDGSNQVYVGGYFTSYDGTSAGHIVRLNPDGSLDATFAVGAGFSDTVRQIVVADDGSNDVYVAGDFTFFNGSSAPSLVRLKPNGTLDGTFSIGTGFNLPVETLLLAPDGSHKLYAAGLFNQFKGVNVGQILRLNPSGSVDNTFATGAGFDADVTGLAASTDGSFSIYAVGSFGHFGATSLNGIARLTSGGALDTTFQVGQGFGEGTGVGILAGPSGTGSDTIYAWSNSAQYNTTFSNFFYKLTSTGAADPSFQTGTDYDGEINAILPVTDGTGRYYVGGSFLSHHGQSANQLARVNPDSTLDTTFSTGNGPNAQVRALAYNPLSSTQVYAAGDFTTFGTRAAQGIVRLNSDGSLDPSFSSSNGADNPIYAIAFADDGSGDIYIAGTFGNYGGTSAGGIARLKPSGALDPTFNVGTGCNDKVVALALVPDGTHRIFVAGAFTQYAGTAVPGLVRLNPDGSIDGTFNTGTGFTGAIATSPSDTYYQVGLAVDSSYRLYIVGGFGSYDGNSVGRIARIQTNGAFDSTFNTGAGLDYTASNVLIDGSVIYVSGYFSNYNTGQSSNFVAVDTTGTVLAHGGGNGLVSPSSQVNAMALMPGTTPYLLLGGRFNAYYEFQADNLLRLSLTLDPW